MRYCTCYLTKQWHCGSTVSIEFSETKFLESNCTCTFIYKIIYFILFLNKLASSLFHSVLKRSGDFQHSTGSLYGMFRSLFVNLAVHYRFVASIADVACPPICDSVTTSSVFLRHVVSGERRSYCSIFAVDRNITLFSRSGVITSLLTQIPS